MQLRSDPKSKFTNASILQRKFQLCFGWVMFQALLSTFSAFSNMGCKADNTGTLMGWANPIDYFSDHLNHGGRAVSMRGVQCTGNVTTQVLFVVSKLYCTNCRATVRFPGTFFNFLPVKRTYCIVSSKAKDGAHYREMVQIWVTCTWEKDSRKRSHKGQGDCGMM